MPREFDGAVLDVARSHAQPRTLVLDRVHRRHCERPALHFLNHHLLERHRLHEEHPGERRLGGQRGEVGAHRDGDHLDGCRCGARGLQQLTVDQLDAGRHTFGRAAAFSCNELTLLNWPQVTAHPKRVALSLLCNVCF